MATVTRKKSSAPPREKPPRKKVAKKVKAKVSYTDDSISLPTDLNEVSDDLFDFVICLYGEKGVGKTSLASQFDDALVCMFERGRRNLKIKQVPKPGEPELDWERFKEYVAMFLKSNLRTLVIDTIDECYMQCFHHVCGENRVTHPENHKSGYKIWDEIAAEFAGLLNLIHESGKCLVLISHCKSRVLPSPASKKGLARINSDDESADKSERLEPTCKPAAFRFIQQICDFVFYYGYKDGERAITVRSPHNVYWTSGGVEDRYLDPEGNPVECFLIGNSPKKAFQSLLDGFNNKLYDVDYVPTKKSKTEDLPRKKTVKKKARRS